MLPTKLRSERCANDLNHFQLKVPSGTFSIAEIGRWTSGTPANSYPRQDVPEIRDSRLVLSSRMFAKSYPLRVIHATGHALKLVPY